MHGTGLLGLFVYERKMVIGAFGFFAEGALLL